MDPATIRSFIVKQAEEFACCTCSKPLKSGNKECPADTHTCGFQQAAIHASEDMEVGSILDEMGHQKCIKYEQ